MDAELAGKRVVVTRPLSDSAELVEGLRARGAEVVVFPTIEVAPVEDLSALDDALTHFERYQMVLVGSKHAVDILAARCGRLGVAVPVPVGCVGAKTAAHVRAQLPVCGEVVAPDVARAEALADLVAARFSGPGGGLTGRRFLFPRTPEGRDTLIERLKSLGAAVDAIDVYRIVPAAPAQREVVAALQAADVFTFLSGETLRCFFEVVPEAEGRRLLARAKVAVIGPVAEARARDLGVRIDVVPKTASVEALVEALARSL